jgi:HEXXH motif-containing protein
MISRLSLAERDLAVLLAGGGSSQTFGVLGAAQLSRNLVMLRGILDLAQDRAPEDAVRAGLQESYQVLSDLDGARPGSLHGLIGYPYVGEWAFTCLQRLWRANDATDVPLWLDLAHLGAIAAAAAILLDVQAEVVVPVRDGLVAVPSIGSLAVGKVARSGLVRLRRSDTGYVQLEGSTQMSPVVCLAPGDAGWLPLRRLTVVEHGKTIDLLLDDADPYRDRHGAGATGRLSEREAADLEADVGSAWRLLVARHGEQASAIAAGLRVLTPLRERPDGAAVSATSRAAAGAIAVSPMRQPERLACALLHESEHSKLNGVLGLVDLVQASRGRRFYSPWRNEPRPAVGLLYGVYAWLAVASFWRDEARAAPQDFLLAFESARSEGQLRVGSARLAATGLLTGAGKAVVAAAGSVVRSSQASASRVPADVSRVRQLAEDLVLDHQVRWRLRNLRVPGWVLTSLSARWHAGRNASPAPRYAVVVHEAPALSGISDPRLHHAMQILERASAMPNRPPSGIEADPDLALILGDYDAAARGYEQLIVNAGDDGVQAWAGLVVARAAGGLARAEPRPELLKALYVALSSDPCDEAPSPARLAAWLDGEGAE